ncbi:hypothetical protein B0T22DRAFT_477117 [Podospora appendiculata]|uniref:Uncharacterized protein n=1 Tax=Podospora appendiculata TaxID=314037 RepID=A0AAE1CH47_9PEZI|nr:hypothetical protein B0T22DRAFT_477117 [Podospora appendiculata]
MEMDRRCPYWMSRRQRENTITTELYREVMCEHCCQQQQEQQQKDENGKTQNVAAATLSPLDLDEVVHGTSDQTNSQEPGEDSGVVSDSTNFTDSMWDTDSGASCYETERTRSPPRLADFRYLVRGMDEEKRTELSWVLVNDHGNEEGEVESPSDSAPPDSTAQVGGSVTDKNTAEALPSSPATSPTHADERKAEIAPENDAEDDYGYLGGEDSN